MGYLQQLQHVGLEVNAKFMGKNNRNEAVRLSAITNKSEGNANPTRILILEDNRIYLSGLLQILASMNYANVTACKSYDEALAEVQANSYDIVLSDINLSDKRTGFDFAHSLREFSSIPIIFITANLSEHIYELSKSVFPSHFMSKQFSPLELRQAIELSIFAYGGKVSDTPPPAPSSNTPKADLSNGFFVKKGKHLKKLLLHEIDIIESDRNYSTIKTENDNSYIIAMPLAEIETLLNPYGFVRVHRSFIVNWSKIHSVNTTENVLMLNERQIDIGKSYKNEVYDRLTKLSS
ncbi:MAG: response regulator transcription factor [Saprospiraceae bacterium]|nr:response regulator transcription factor [Saprospiraceae bacterium]